MMTQIQIFIGSIFVRWLNRHGLDVCLKLEWSYKRPTKPGWY